MELYGTALRCDAMRCEVIPGAPAGLEGRADAAIVGGGFSEAMRLPGGGFEHVRTCSYLFGWCLANYGSM
jgi:hypothetical protein